jgi:hypothetical protein
MNSTKIPKFPVRAINPGHMWIFPRALSRQMNSIQEIIGVFYYFRWDQ